ncbi:hypothetical protein BH20ACT11_BH20ACT11_14540 [soil metagenome]
MRRLREQEQLLMGEEEHHNLFDGLQDIRYARDFLHVVGPLGTAEHARFDEMSWGYGDPTYMGGDLLEVFDSQVKSVLHTLFGVLEAHEREEAEDDQDAPTPLRADIHHAGIAMGEDNLLADLVSLDGGPLQAETVGRISPGTMAEHLTHQAHTPTTSRANYPGEGVASIGCGRMNSLGYRVAPEPTGDFEDVIGIEISGGPESVATFITNMRAGCGEGESPNLYRWKAGSTPARMLGEGGSPRDAVIMLVGFEYFDLRSMMQDIVFAQLLAAWREIKRSGTQ